MWQGSTAPPAKPAEVEVEQLAADGFDWVFGVLVYVITADGGGGATHARLPPLRAAP
ncbi:hypothetical protein [Actinomadura luteofluorescens]|uniref:hypothetical protein n=1 Tax=Actinomadura luteofluorescens TaxID=46163 RepID=UPI003D8A838E